MSAPVPSVVQAFAIVRALGAGRALTLSEVAQTCGISPSSCLALLRTLVGEGVLHLGEGKRYALARAWAGAVGEDGDEYARVVAAARPLLDRAARAWGAPIGLWRLAGRDRLSLAALGQSLEATRIHMEEGQRQPIGGGAVGRALAAAQRVSSDELARRFAAVRWERPLTLAGYAAQVAEAARVGYAVDDGLGHAGITSLAVCRAGVGHPMCVSASVFAGSRTPGELADLAAALAALARDLAESQTVPPRKVHA